jgi:Nucleotidyl transferase AbiEii toxin, Type IV TA system
MLEAANIDLDDFLVYSPRFEERGGRGQQAVAYRMDCELAGRFFERIAVDVGLDDPLVRQADLVATPGLLDFAGFGAFQVPALPLEQQVAEKLHAYSREYGRGASTRVKDLLDIVLIATSEGLNGSLLREALEAIFIARGTHELPPFLSGPPADWRVAYGRAAEELAMDLTLDQAYELAASILNPVLTGTAAEGAEWDPTTLAWS